MGQESGNPLYNSFDFYSRVARKLQPQGHFNHSTKQAAAAFEGHLLSANLSGGDAGLSFSSSSLRGIYLNVLRVDSILEGAEGQKYKNSVNPGPHTVRA